MASQLSRGKSITTFLNSGLISGLVSTCIEGVGTGSGSIGALVADRSTQRRIPIPFKQCCCLGLSTGLNVTHLWVGSASVGDDFVDGVNVGFGGSDHDIGIGTLTIHDMAIFFDANGDFTL